MEQSYIAYCRAYKTKTLSEQISRCNQYAESEGILIDKIFSDHGGSDIASARAGLRDMLKYLESSQSPVVVLVGNIKRLSSIEEVCICICIAIEKRNGVLLTMNRDIVHDYTKENIISLAKLMRNFRAKTLERSRINRKYRQLR